jgi:small conductance mechanosensitive channel
MEQLISAKELATWQNLLIKHGTQWGANILAALLIFFIGKWVAARIVVLMRRAMNRAKIDATLTSFLANISNALLLALVVIAALTKLGIETNHLAAIFAAAGLAIGLAMQNSLSNLAAGIMIIIFRPFKVGDYVEVSTIAGTVEELSIFTTKFKSLDNIELIVPNGSIISGVIKNYSAKPIRMLDLTFSIAHEHDLRIAKNILHKVIADESRLLDAPEPVIAVKNIGEATVDFAVRPWVNTSDYMATKFALTEAVKLAFDEAGIKMPCPQKMLYTSLK